MVRGNLEPMESTAGPTKLLSKERVSCGQEPDLNTEPQKPI